jgi:hypothetical protein
LRGRLPRVRLFDGAVWPHLWVENDQLADQLTQSLVRESGIGLFTVFDFLHKFRQLR